MNEEKLSKVGIIGGTFDPIHIGHLLTANIVLEKRNLDKVIFIPCHISPHKTDLVSSEARHRLNMIKLAIKNNEKFEFSDYEIEKGSISYTIDTLREFNKKYDNIDFIIGFDNLVTFDTWKDPDKLLKLCNLVVMKRSDNDVSKIEHEYAKHAILVETPEVEVSSTEIRERVRLVKSIDYMVLPDVKDYILKENLYK